MNLIDLTWRAAAFVLSRRSIAYYLIRRAQRTPYFHLPGYMERWWLFNAYDSNPDLTAEQRRAAIRFPRLPSVRVHHILREDLAEHPHDHPWDARTIILDGWYVERRHRADRGLRGPRRVMARGNTTRIAHGSFHHIEAVSDAGVWTLFFTWDYRGSWGFLVDGKKVLWREYEALAYERAIRAECEKAEAGHKAVWMLVAAGYVDQEKANKALRIAHGFEKGPLPHG